MENSCPLPTEVLISIIEHCVANHYCDKNSLLQLRTVSKLFDDVLKPYVLRTVQLDFTRLCSDPQYPFPPDEAALSTVGDACKALYLDMMLVRDDGEIAYLRNIFKKLPSMVTFVTSVLDSYCLSDKTFTEVDYRNALGCMLDSMLKVDAVRLNLPFQLISKHCGAATMLLGNTFEALARRPEESSLLKTLVLENVADVSVCRLWRNPQDVKNIIDVLSSVEHLVLTLRIHEHDTGFQPNHVIFRQCFWEMIEKAGRLETMCLVGLNMDERPMKSVKLTTMLECTQIAWQLRSLPTIRRPKTILPHLTHLELRRIQILPYNFLTLFKCFGSSLKELYLDHVYLKTVCVNPNPNPVAIDDPNNKVLWVGFPNQRPDQHHRWIATAIRQLGVKLRVCRATNLGYDAWVIGGEPSTAPRFDLEDPCGLDRSLDQRFVEVIMGHRQPHGPDGSPVEYLPELTNPDETETEQTQAYAHALADKPPPAHMDLADWDAAAYLGDRSANKTSIWQKTIDGYFPNCNKFTLDELHRFANLACEGMNELTRRCYEDYDEVNQRYVDEALPAELTVHAPHGGEAAQETPIAATEVSEAGLHEVAMDVAATEE